MKPVPGTLRAGGMTFPSTRWSVVLDASQDHPSSSTRKAVVSFCQAYWPPLYTFVRRRGHSPEDAQDLVQGFFAHLLQMNTLERARRDKGRLRAFLVGSLENFLFDQQDRTRALKRGGGTQIVSLEDLPLEYEASLASPTREDPVREYDRGWAIAVMRRSWEQLRNTYASEGKGGLFEALRPLVIGGEAVPSNQEEVARELNLPPATLRTQLRTLRQRYRELVRDEVGATVGDPEEVADEMRYLHRLLIS